MKTGSVVISLFCIFLSPLSLALVLKRQHLGHNNQLTYLQMSRYVTADIESMKACHLEYISLASIESKHSAATAKTFAISVECYKVCFWLYFRF